MFVELNLYVKNAFSPFFSFPPTEEKGGNGKTVRRFLSKYLSL